MHSRPYVDRSSTAACDTCRHVQITCTRPPRRHTRSRHRRSRDRGRRDRNRRRLAGHLHATLTGPFLHTTATGRGTATITFYPTKACWKFSYNGIDPPNISGIHVVPPPPAGYHKLSVFPFTATTSQAPGCEKLDRWGARAPSEGKKIVANPSGFYVIIGNGPYPNGAIGGVLHRGNYERYEPAQSHGKCREAHGDGRASLLALTLTWQAPRPLGDYLCLRYGPHQRDRPSTRLACCRVLAAGADV